MAPEPHAPARRPTRGPGVVATACIALAVFLALIVVLATQLRNDPRSVGLASQKARVVIVRRVYETVVHERVIGAGAATGSGATTVSSSSANVASPALPATPVTTRTS
jgi:hypothetical protein